MVVVLSRSAPSVFALLVAAIFLVSLPLPVKADLLISPIRSVLDDNNRSATLVLRNTSDGSRTYRLSWVEQLMNESGQYRRVPSSENPVSLEERVRFSPRQITVGPGENQTVRLSYRPAAGTTPGEYRSHLLFEILPDVSEPQSVMEMESGIDGVGVQLRMMMSFSIPVIVRHGITPPEVRISDVQVEPAEAGGVMGLSVTLERTGDSSSFGDIVVEMQEDENSPVVLVGRSTSVAVFTEANRRRVSVPLRQEGVPAGAWVRVAYEGREEFSGRVWDERVFRSQ